MNWITNCFSAASIVISPKVGVHVQLMRYLQHSPDSIAKPNSEIISDAPVPTTCAPISVSSSLSVINLTKPFVSSNDKARPLAA